MSNPTLLMLAGLPGTGKSTLAAAIAAKLGWLVLDKDLLNTRLLEAGLQQAQAAPLAYELVLSLADTFVVQQQFSLILDTAGRQPFLLERARMIAHNAGGRLKIIRCFAPAAVRQARLAARKAGPAQWTSDQTTAEQEIAWYAHLPADALLLSTDQAVDDLMRVVVPFIQS